VSTFPSTRRSPSALGAAIPKGRPSSYGPPGTGKRSASRGRGRRGRRDVLLAQLSAYEFIEMVVGVGAKHRVRDLSTAKKAPPAIIFIRQIER